MFLALVAVWPFVGGEARRCWEYSAVFDTGFSMLGGRILASFGKRYTTIWLYIGHTVPACPCAAPGCPRLGAVFSGAVTPSLGSNDAFSGGVECRLACGV